MHKRHLVVSAVNLVDGGTLEILRQCLHEAARLPGWRVTAIVNDSGKVGVAEVDYIERPDVKPSWLRRIYFEYFECAGLANQLRPDFWLSLHDMTPNLGALSGRVPQAVYCHNAMCFYDMTLREMWLEPVLILFQKLYSIFYRVNLKRNGAVIVQQDWIRKEFIQNFGCGHVIVAHPSSAVAASSARVHAGRRFFYPSYPRVFKNFETVLSAWELLCQDPSGEGELTLTINADSNRYGRELVRRFGHLRNVRFIGRVSHTEVQALYKSNDCLVFASKLETWGLPISEAQDAGLTILASDLPYAHETVGAYDGAAFFSAQDVSGLAELMRQFRRGQLVPAPVRSRPPPRPFAESWSNLLEQLLPIADPRPQQSPPRS